MRYILSSICPKHGYHKGGDCPNCEHELVNEVFMTNKDMLYNFYSTAIDKKIESKSQWKRELKSRGLTDDFNQSWKSREKEIRSAKEPNPKISREECKNYIRQELKNRGLYSREKLFLKKPKLYYV